MKTRDWMDEGTRLVLAAIDRLDDAALDAATGLPGWSRRHILAHLHDNAQALRRLARWARTGQPCAMYASSEQRAAQIESGARLPADQLRRLVRDSAAALAHDLDTLPEPAWRRQVVTAHGRHVPATEIPWLRAREVAVHAVDLNAGVDFDDLPAELTAALLTDALTRRISQGHGPALARWLTGRTPHAPELRPWL